MKSFFKSTLYLLEALPIYLVYGIFWLLPVDITSYCLGKLARVIGPFLKASLIGKDNLKKAFPEKTEQEINSHLKEVWEMLGRVAGEFPHLKSLTKNLKRVEVEGLKTIEMLKTYQGPVLFFTGHLANWEILPSVVRHYGIAMDIVGRAANNPFINRLITWTRQLNSNSMIPKGAYGSRHLLKKLNENGRIGMLVDQKQNDGISVPFFGHPCMTAPAIARLALKFNAPIIPVEVVRLKGAHFKAVFYPPLHLPTEGSNGEKTFKIMREINQILEGWIRAKPGAWLWLHRRWPDSKKI